MSGPIGVTAVQRDLLSEILATAGESIDRVTRCPVRAPSSGAGRS